MRILAAGGGSGGHVTPVVAVIREIRKKHPRAEIRFWCDNKFEPQARGIIHGFDDRIVVQSIASGKFRRYHQYAWWRQLFRLRDIVLPNIRDGFLVVVGFFQSIWRMIWWRPDVVFCKGGFVCLPIGLAAKLLGIPLVIHDSDAHPGLTNRVLGRFANQIATGASLEYYSYPAERSRYVGIPVRPDFRPFSAKQRIE
ncbi:MAG: glycosyltransferase, partial [Candidatus Saccharimonadaceae bacterium]